MRPPDTEMARKLEGLRGKRGLSCLPWVAEAGAALVWLRLTATVLGGGPANGAEGGFPVDPGWLSA